MSNFEKYLEMLSEDTKEEREERMALNRGISDAKEGKSFEECPYTGKAKKDKRLRAAWKRGFRTVIPDEY